MNADAPAYPTLRHRSERGDEWTETEDGMTVRQRFAMAAMQGLLSQGHKEYAIAVAEGTLIVPARQAVPSLAVQYADLLIAELDKQP